MVHSPWAEMQPRTEPGMPQPVVTDLGIAEPVVTETITEPPSEPIPARLSPQERVPSGAALATKPRPHYFDL